jgi:hypothetical protein
VVVLDKERDYRYPPYKVRLPNGSVAFFQPSTESSRSVNTGVESNRSQQAISFFFHVRRLQLSQKHNIRIPNLLGFVVSDSLRGEGSEDTDLAGILLEWIDGECLMDSATHITARDKHAAWKDQLIETVTALHQHGISSVEISPFNIVVDQQGVHAWLTEFAVYKLSGESRDEDAGVDKKNNGEDFKRIDLIFDQWLADIQAEVPPSTAEEMRIARALFNRFPSQIGMIT